jgi:serine protease Do
MNRALLWLGPITVLVVAGILAVMYGWVGSMGPIGEAGEGARYAAVQTPVTGGQIVHHGQFPTGVGNGQIQLLNKPTFPVGVGNGQIQLIQKPTFPAGIGNGQMQLLNTPTYPMGVGNGQIQLINTPTYPMGVGNGQIQLIARTGPGGPYLGLSLAQIDPAVAQSLGLVTGVGVYVTGVIQVSPAQKAGLKKGDVLLRCDHQDVGSPDAVGNILVKKKAGDVIKLVVNRAGTKKSFHVTLANAPLGVDTGVVPKTVWLGADIQDLDAVMKIQFNLPDTRGVIVSHVTPGSPAATAGMADGDVVRRFGETRIRDVKQLQSLILKGKTGQKVRLAVLRGGNTLAVDVVLGLKPVGGQRVPFVAPAELVIEGTWIGMDVSELGAADATALGLPSATRGILVNDVESPPATTVGFQTGDVIVGVSGIPTPDMKHFVSATKSQPSAVVDVIRGNSHMLISVPPPGFTQQGTKLNTGMGNNFKQVALTTPVVRPSGGRFAVLAAGPDLNSPVASESGAGLHVVLVDPQQGAYAILAWDGRTPLPVLVDGNQAGALVCGSISGQTAAALQAKGVVVYSGVVGRAMDAVTMYEARCLSAMNAF